MAACARCGASLPDPAGACPACGEKPKGSSETVPLGTPGALPFSGHATLVLGSGPPSIGVAPDSARPEPEPPPSPPNAEDPPPRAPEPERRVARRLPPPDPDLDDVDEPASKPPRRFVAAHAWLAGTLLVLLGLAGALWFSRGTGPRLRGQVSFDERGQPRLELTCGACPEGTEVRAGSAVAKLVAGRATLTLEPPVSLGEQRFEVTLTDTNGRVERQAVPVKIEWIVSADLRGLSQPSPKLAVVVDADPNIGVIVDGHALPPTPESARRYEIDIREDVSGAASSPTRVSRRIPYVITRPDGSALRGELELATDVVPLRVDAPGDSLVIDGSSFMLAGVTQADGSVTVEGRPITVDPAGRFAQLMSVSAIGDTSVTVRASAPGRAPRLIPVRVKRVANLATEAESFSRRATTAYTALAEPLEEKRGWAVALTGKVKAIKSDGYSTELELDVTSGCAAPPCPLLARWGARTATAAGDTVTIYGHVAGKTALPGSERNQPEVRVEFLRGQP